ITDALGTWDRNNVISLSEHPSQCELCRRAALPLRKILHVRRKLKISIEGLSLEARIRVPPVVGGEIGWLLNGPCQETSSKGTVWDEADAQLATCCKRAIALNIARPKRILGLESGNWVQSGRASQCANTCLRKPESAHLSRTNQ